MDLSKIPPFRPRVPPYGPQAPPFRAPAIGFVSTDFATSQLQRLSISKSDLIQYVCLDVLRHVFEMVRILRNQHLYFKTTKIQLAISTTPSCALIDIEEVQ